MYVIVLPVRIEFECILRLVQSAWLFGQLRSLTMAGEQTTETAGESKERLRLAALASQSEAEAAAAAAAAPGGDNPFRACHPASPRRRCRRCVRPLRSASQRPRPV